jgi:broad specificity phosphatase PhoE
MILLRHGQSEFNLLFTRTRVDPGIPDPKLTDEGWRQAREAGAALRGAGLRRIVCSPYRRALQTASGVNEALDLPIEVTPLVRERYGFVCDIGSPASALSADFPHLDFSAVDERWWPEAEEPEHGVVARAADFRALWAARQDWAHTLVISHWGFILGLTGESVPNGAWRRFDPTHAAPDRLVWRP